MSSPSPPRKPLREFQPHDVQGASPKTPAARRNTQVLTPNAVAALSNSRLGCHKKAVFAESWTRPMQVRGQSAVSAVGYRCCFVGRPRLCSHPGPSNIQSDGKPMQHRLQEGSWTEPKWCQHCGGFLWGVWRPDPSSPQNSPRVLPRSGLWFVLVGMPLEPHASGSLGMLFWCPWGQGVGSWNVAGVLYSGKAF